MSSRETCHDLPSLTHHTAGMAELGKQIKAEREAKGWTQAELARKLGVTRNAVSLWENGVTEPTLPKVRKMIRLFGVSGLGGVNQERAASLLPDVSGELMPVDGYAAASTWQEIDQLGQEPQKWVPMSKDPAFGHRKQYAIEIMGTSMDKVLSHGDYAIVVEAFGQAPRDGDLVVVRRIKGNLVERTVKRFRENGGPGSLMPESTDPRHEPIPVEGDGETSIEIEAYVVGVYRRLRTPQ